MPGFRIFLSLLVYGLPVLLVSFAVLIGGGVLAGALGDDPAGRVLAWIAAGIGMLLIVDFVLLLVVLGVSLLNEKTPDRPPREERGESEE